MNFLSKGSRKPSLVTVKILRLLELEYIFLNMRLEHLLPQHHLHPPSPTLQTIPPEKVKNITTRLRYLVEQLIHEELNVRTQFIPRGSPGHRS